MNNDLFKDKPFILSGVLVFILFLLGFYITNSNRDLSYNAVAGKPPQSVKTDGDMGIEKYLTCALFVDGNSKELFLLNGMLSKGTRLSNNDKQECIDLGGIDITTADIEKFVESKKSNTK